MSGPVNPFVTDRPVTGEDLCGRERLLATFLDALSGAAPARVTGEPGSGFTSLAREAGRRWSDGAGAAVYVEASLAEDAEELRSLVVTALSASGSRGREGNPRILLLVDGLGRISDPPELAEALAEAPEGAAVALLGPGAGGAGAEAHGNGPALSLDRVPYAAWLPFALERFLVTDRWIGDEHVAACVDRTGGHPRHTPALLAEVWNRSGDEGRVGDGTIEAAWQALLGRAGGWVRELLAGLTSNQRRVLRGLAVEGQGGEPVRPYSSEFLGRHGLSSPSSVQRSVASLEERRLVVEDEGGPRVRDPVLRGWLRRHRARAAGSGPRP
ncbi:MAG TPA: hypothetical protein VLL48_14245 [Longimicrobiales bacterium]|nr:hypothetical protein [Longimicrobiales bacterium]